VVGDRCRGDCLDIRDVGRDGWLKVDVASVDSFETVWLSVSLVVGFALVASIVGPNVARLGFDCSF